MFNKWNQLVLDINDYFCWQMCSFELLSKLINLSQLNEIWLFISCRENFDPKVINTLLEQASNVHTLGITQWCFYINYRECMFCINSSN